MKVFFVLDQEFNLWAPWVVQDLQMDMLVNLTLYSDQMGEVKKQMSYLEVLQVI